MRNNRRVRLGVVGCGVIGQEHIKAAIRSESVELVAVSDTSPTALQRAVERFGVGRAYQDPERLFADQMVDAVVLALPTSIRSALAPEAFKARKHVLLEKPAAMNAAELRDLIAVRGDLVGATCSSRFRHLESARLATALVASGEIGDVRLLRGLGVIGAPPRPDELPPPWRLSSKLNGGGVLVNWGIYDLDFLLGICGWTLSPMKAFATMFGITPDLAGYVAPGSDAETHVSALVRFDGGQVLSLERGEYIAAPDESRYEVVGTKGTLHLRMLPEFQPAIVLHRHDQLGVHSEIVPSPVESYDDIMSLRLLDNFAAAVLGQAPPATSLEQALVVQKITDACYSSARDGLLALIN